MKSKYKKSVLFLQEVVLLAIGIGMALLFWRGRYDTDSFKRTLVGGIGLMIAFFAVFLLSILTDMLNSVRAAQNSIHSESQRAKRR